MPLRALLKSYYYYHPLRFGCCPDGITPAGGKNLENCTVVECDENGICEPCSENKFGCCPDGITPAKGEELGGCSDTPKNETGSVYPFKYLDSKTFFLNDMFF